MAKTGLACLLCYAIHATYHLLNDRPEDLLWACHVGAIAIGFGMLTAATFIASAGTLLLAMGTPLWLLDLAAGGEFMPTSIFTHIVALGLGLHAIRRFGIGQGAAWMATLLLVTLIGISRAVTPEGSNVNLAFSIQPGLENVFPSHTVYIAAMIGCATAYFFILEELFRRYLDARPDQRDMT